MKKIENISMYLECLVKNKYTILSLYFFLMGIVNLILRNNISNSVLAMTISATILWLMDWGVPSYHVCKNTMELMIKFQTLVETDAYFADIGNRVAIRRFRNKYPTEYNAMLEKADSKKSTTALTIIIFI